MSIADESIPFTVGDWRVEPELNRILRGDEIVKIDPRNMKVLQLLASRAGQVIAQNEIENSVWADVVVTPNSVYQSVAQLRRALGDDKASPRYIETISRKGYRLIADVRSVDLVPGAVASFASQVATTSTISRRLAVALTCTVLAALSVQAGIFFYEEEKVRPHSVPTTASETRRSEIEFDPPLVVEGTLESKSLRAQLLIEMGAAALVKGRRNEGLAHLKRALHLQQEIYGEGHPQLGSVLSNLAVAYLWHDQYSEAEASARDAVKVFESVSEMNPDRILAIQKLGEVLTDSGKPDEAKPYLEQSLMLSGLVFGESSFETVDIQIALSKMHFAAGRLDVAEAFVHQAVEAHTRLRGDQQTTALYLLLWADLLIDQHRFDEARMQAELSLKMLGETSRPDHPYVASAQEKLAKSFLASGEYSRAEALARQSLTVWQQNDGWSRRLANTASLLGEVVLAQGRIADAEKYLTYASRGIQDTHGWAEQRAYKEHSKRIAALERIKAEKTRLKSQVAELAGI
jgi:DNA-binding winged helix-turn-helix (wHTH) protein/tetratricopeptide (TPR) repeat protein